MNNIISYTNDIYTKLRSLADATITDKKIINKLIIQTNEHIDMCTNMILHTNNEVKRVCISYYATYFVHLKVFIKKYREQVAEQWPTNPMVNSFFMMPIKCHDHLDDYMNIDNNIRTLAINLAHIYDECVPNHHTDHLIAFDYGKQQVHKKLSKIREYNYRVLYNNNIISDLGSKLNTDMMLLVIIESLTRVLIEKKMKQLLDPMIKQDLNERKQWLRNNYTNIYHSKYKTSIEMPISFYML